MKTPRARAGLVLLAVATAFVFRFTTGVYFAQDDFYDLAIATGDVTPTASLWRLISRSAVTGLIYPAFGANPAPYHVVVLLVHIVNSWLVHSLARRWVSPPAALVAAAFFAVHPSVFTALHWISARADVMATCFGLLALLAFLRGDRWRWLSPPLFFASLLSKESLVLLPIVALIALRTAPRESAISDSRTRRHRLVAACMGLGAAVFTAYLLAAGKSGVGVTGDASGAYALSAGASVWKNLLTYVGWAVDPGLFARPLRFVDAVDPALFVPGFVVVLISALLATRHELRERGWLVGVAGFLLFIAPVLFLANHTYRYYLYGPLVATSLCVGAAADLGLERLARAGAVRALDVRTGHQLGRWILAAVILVAFVLVGQRAVSTNLVRRSTVYPVLYADPTVDRARIARQMIQGLQYVDLPPEVHLELILRERAAALARLSRGLGGSVPPEEPGYAERNVKAAVLDGLGLRVMVPHVRRAEFVLEPPASWDGRLVVLYSPVGEVAVFDSVGLEEAWSSDWLVRW